MEGEGRMGHLSLRFRRCRRCISVREGRLWVGLRDRWVEGHRGRMAARLQGTVDRLARTVGRRHISMGHLLGLGSLVRL